MALVSIIVPCLNEEAGMRALRERLDAAIPGLEACGHEIEVLLWDNASADRTLDEMRRWFSDHPRFKIHAHPENVNIGGALRLGLPLVRGEVIVHMDSDCTYDPTEIGPLLALIGEGHGIATGSQYHPSGRVEGVPAWRLALSQGASLLYRLVAPVKLYTYTSMFRAYRRSVLEGIRWRSDGFLSNVEIVMEAVAAGASVGEHPTTLATRRFGQSKIRVFRVMRDHLAYLGRLATDGKLRRRIRASVERQRASVERQRAR